jgi:hypothetical protein
MKAFRTVLLGATLVAAAVVSWAAPAGACSCVGSGGPPPIEFEGRAVEVVGEGTVGQLWTFDVARVVRGDVAGRLVADVAAQTDPGPDGIVQTSSCSLGVRLAVGATYGVAGYLGEAPDGEPRVFVNSCGGSVREVQPAPPTTAEEAEPVAEAVGPSVAEPDGSSASWVWAVGGAGTVALGAAVLLVLRARRRSLSGPASP